MQQPIKTPDSSVLLSRETRLEKMEESFPMTGGDGPYSYTKNSTQQKEAAASAKTMLASAILENLVIESSSKQFVIADVGCSTGPNTYIAVDDIIEGVIQKYRIESYSRLPEFLVYFNDQVSNDFNILLTGLPSDRKYFAMGVPGSFHGRLFPKATLNFIYSAFALQWLSKAPLEIGDLNSQACNRGRIYYSNAPDEVGKAYSAQFAKDIESFLTARAQELAPGGLLALLFPGRQDGTLPSQYSLGPLFKPLESCLIEMVDQEIISKDKIDSFNLPIYSPSMEELRALVEKNGYFYIARLETLPNDGPLPLPTAEQSRAGLESILRKHFGTEIIQKLYEKYAKKIAGHPPISVSEGLSIGLFVILKRSD